jgi:sec-independent protein translocase protein TatA
MSSDTPLRFVSNGVGNVRKPDNPNGLWTLEIERMSAFSFIDIAAQIEGIEWILLLIIIAVLLLYGPKKLPELARGVGRALGEFRRGKMEIEREISSEISQIDTRDQRNRLEQAAGALGVPVTGRSEMDVKLDIARAVDKAADTQVVSAAHAIGVYSSGSDVTRLKEQIIKALNV